MPLVNKPNYGWNLASIVFKNDKATAKVVLTGVKSIAANQSLVKKEFGVGFARYTYTLKNDVQCTRIISVKPSMKIHTGNPSFVLTVFLQNDGNTIQDLSYSERTLANYVLNSTQYIEKQKRPLAHEVAININDKKEIGIANISTRANKFLVLPRKEERFVYDVAPPSVFMYAKSAAGKSSPQIQFRRTPLLLNMIYPLSQVRQSHFFVLLFQT